MSVNLVAAIISVAAASALHAATPPLGALAPHASRAPPVCLLAKRGPKPKNPKPAEDDDDEQLLDEEATDNSQSVELVDGMTTPLGREGELEPFPGPPVVTEPVEELDARPLFVLFTRYVEQQMPSEGLVAEYVAWLKAARESGVSLCMPHYMLSAQSFDNWWEYGAVLDDDDVARLDAEEEAAAAAAAEAAALALENGDAEGAAPPPPPLGMEECEASFKIGHLTVCRAESHAGVAGWVAADPVQAAGGYREIRLHEWARLREEALMMPLGGSGECLQPYCVHCLDKPDAGDLRASTREAHLTWMRDSGRVVMAGPLIEPTAGNADGPRVGSLLIVNGDELDEVKDWVQTDPYALAGLFGSVTVAPLNEYAIDDLSEV